MDLITLHPKLTHFPIASLYIAMLLEVIFIFRGNSFYRRASIWLFNFGVVMALVTLVSGLVAAETLGHDSAYHDFIHTHRDVMLISVTVWVLVSVLLHLKKQLGTILPILAMILVAVLVTFGSDLGGRLVFEYGVGVNKPDTYHDVTDETYFCHEQDDCTGDHSEGH